MYIKGVSVVSVWAICMWNLWLPKSQDVFADLLDFTICSTEFSLFIAMTGKYCTGISQPVCYKKCISIDLLF